MEYLLLRLLLSGKELYVIDDKHINSAVERGKSLDFSILDCIDKINSKFFT